MRSDIRDRRHHTGIALCAAVTKILLLEVEYHGRYEISIDPIDCLFSSLAWGIVMPFRGIPILLAAFLSSVSVQGSAGLWTDWEWLNPRPHGHTIYSVAASDSIVVAVGGKMILVSENATDWEVANSDMYLREVIWTGDQFVGVGTDMGIAVTSPDGWEWTIRHPSGPSFGRVVFNGELFVAVGMNETATSSDGVNWTVHTIEEPERLWMLDVTWNGSIFVAVGWFDYYTSYWTPAIFYSEDGAEWTVADLEERSPLWELVSVAWVNDRFLAFDRLSTSFLSSPDGRAWTEETTNLTGAIREIIPLPGEYLGVGSSGQVFRTTGGYSWEASLAEPSSRGLLAITRFQDKLVAVGEQGAITVSADGGYHWDVVSMWEIDIHDSDKIVDLCWEDGILIAISNNGGVFRSLDGLDWELVTGFPVRLFSVRWINEAFWIVGDDSLIATSEDGETWITRSFEDGAVYVDIAGNGEVLTAVGAISSDQLTALVATSSDGYAWNESEIGGGLGFSIKSITWTGTRFVALGSGGSIFRSDDGFQWEVDDLEGVLTIWRVACNGSGKVVAGFDDGILTSDDDGLTWQEINFVYDVLDVIWTGERFVAAGGGIHTSPNGHDWVSSEVGLSGTASHIASNGREIVFSGSWANLMRAKLINILPPQEVVEEPVLD